MVIYKNNKFFQQNKNVVLIFQCGFLLSTSRDSSFNRLCTINRDDIILLLGTYPISNRYLSSLNADIVEHYMVIVPVHTTRYLRLFSSYTQ